MADLTPSEYTSLRELAMGTHVVVTLRRDVLLAVLDRHKALTDAATAAEGLLGDVSHKASDCTAGELHDVNRRAHSLLWDVLGGPMRSRSSSEDAET